MRDHTYRWRVGDVFTNGQYRWEVISVDDEKAVLQSCSTSWATTRPLTFDEWNDGGKWTLVCTHCDEKPQAGVKDDHGKLIPLCDNCLSNQGEAQSERRL